MAVFELHRGVADVLHSSAGFLSVTFFLDAAVDVMRMLKTARNTDACKAITAELPGPIPNGMNQYLMINYYYVFDH